MNEEILVTPLMAAHLFAGIGAVAVGTFQLFFMPRGTKEHKKLGWFWAGLLAFLAVSALWDFVGDGWLSIPGHIFTLAAFIQLPLAIWAARNGHIKLHKISMTILFVITIGATIALTLGPGRLLNSWFFG